jgi:tetratricopeptide (TPR) repeat protein
MLIFFQVSFPLRPHLATYLGVTILGTFLLRHRNETDWKRFWPMALLQIAWTNCHSAFVLGPIMVGLFGAEMALRGWLREKALPPKTLVTWAAAFALILLACLVNPYGWARFYPPLFQDRLESIRAYVSEMQPLAGPWATLAMALSVVTVIVVVAAMIRRGGAVCYSFVVIAFLLYFEAQSVMKAWPIFGLYVPLVVLSTAALGSPVRKRASWPGVLVLFMATVVVALALASRLNPQTNSSVQRQWHEYAAGHTELPVEAATWMTAHRIEGRLFNRCEDGGWLQMSGFDHGEVFADTGFGKYDEAFIHEVGLVNERPAFMPHFVRAYQPDFIVSGNICYQWPYYLRQNGWRLIFYSPNSSVWTRAGTRPDLPTVPDADVISAFDRDLAVNGMPVDASLFCRIVISLHSLGLEDFAIAKLTGTPAPFHRTPLYWVAVRLICTSDPSCSALHRDQFLREAESLQDDSLTAEFRAYAYDKKGDVDQSLKILQAIPPSQLSDSDATLLLQIDLDRHLAGTLDLARRTGPFDLGNGAHWRFLAEAEEEAGHPDAAAVAWKKAVFYYPDDDALMKAAAAFAAKYHDDALGKAIAESSTPYGLRSH